MRVHPMFAFSAAVIALATPAIAAENVFRHYLSSPIFFAGDDNEGPPDNTENNGPLQLIVNGFFPEWATVGDEVDIGFDLAGGKPPYGITASGDLPFAFASGDRVIDGIYTGAGSYLFHFNANDSSTPTKTDASDEYRVDVAFPLSLDPYPAGTLQATVGVPVNLEAPATHGGTAPYLYALNAAHPGVTLGADGLVTVVPQSVGPFDLQLKATDAHGREAITSSRAINVSAPLDITAPATPLVLRVGANGAPFATTISGGRAPIALTASTLPAGLTATAGQITGTVTTAGTGTATVSATDVDGRTDSATVPWTANAQLAMPTTNTIKVVQRNQTASFAYSASGRVGPTTYELIDSNLPANMTLSSAGSLSISASNTIGTWTAKVRATDSADGATALSPVQTVYQDDLASFVLPSSASSSTVAALYTYASGDATADVTLPVGGQITLTYSTPVRGSGCVLTRTSATSTAAATYRWDFMDETGVWHSGSTQTMGANVWNAGLLNGCGNAAMGGSEYAALTAMRVKAARVSLLSATGSLGITGVSFGRQSTFPTP